MDPKELRLPRPAAGFGQQTDSNSATSGSSVSNVPSAANAPSVHQPIQQGTSYSSGIVPIGNVMGQQAIPPLSADSRLPWQMDIDDNGSQGHAFGPQFAGSAFSASAAVTARKMNPSTDLPETTPTPVARVPLAVDTNAQIQQTVSTSSTAGVPCAPDFQQFISGQQQSLITPDVQSAKNLVQQANQPQICHAAATSSFPQTAVDFAKQVTPETQGQSVQNVPLHQLQQFQATNVGLTNVPIDDATKIQADAEAAIWNKLTEEQISNLKVEAQAAVLKQITPEQMRQLQAEAEASIWQKIQEEKFKEFQAQQQSVAQQQEAAIQGHVPQDVNIGATGHVGLQQPSMGSQEELIKITMQKADGRSREFYVKDEHGHEIFNYCERIDVASSSTHSGSVVSPSPAVQRFPPQSIQHGDMGQLHQIAHSQHSDTSSSIASATPSFHSVGSAAEHSALTPSATTSGEYSSLWTEHITALTKVELANLDSIQAELELKRAQLNMKLQQVRSNQNLERFGQDEEIIKTTVKLKRSISMTWTENERKIGKTKHLKCLHRQPSVRLKNL